MLWYITLHFQNRFFFSKNHSRMVSACKNLDPDQTRRLVQDCLQNLSAGDTRMQRVKLCCIKESTLAPAAESKPKQFDQLYLKSGFLDSIKTERCQSKTTSDKTFWICTKCNYIYENRWLVLSFIFHSCLQGIIETSMVDPWVCTIITM